MEKTLLRKKALLFIAITFIASMSALPGAYGSVFTATPPVVDGNASEWTSLNSTRITVNGGFIHLMNDSTNLYVLIDVTGDTYDDPPSPTRTGGDDDFFMLAFDVDRNGSITSSIDLMFDTTIQTLNPCLMVFVNSNPPQLSGCSSPSGYSVARGFGTSVNSATPHRIWELQILRSMIGAGSPNSPIRFTVRLDSKTPHLIAQTPSNYLDFSNALPDQLDQPVAYYPFDGNANDASGNGYNGTPSGGVSYTADRFCNLSSAVSFDGSSGSIITPALNFAGSQSVSVSLWLKANGVQPGVPRDYYLVVDNGAFGVIHSFYPYPTPGLNQIGFAVSGATTGSAGGYIDPGSWYHFVGTYDGTTVKAYINGSLIQQTNFGGPMNNPNSPLNFGGVSPYPYYWNGSLDDVRIYNRALTDTEVAQLYSDEYGLIDRTKWADLEVFRRVNNGVLESELRRYGSNGSNYLVFNDSGNVNSFQADVTVKAYQNNGSYPHASLLGRVYRGSYNGVTGDIIGIVGIGHNPTKNRLEGFWSISRCTTANCNLPNEYDQICTGSFDTVIGVGVPSLNTPYQLSFFWDQSANPTFTFGIGGHTIDVNSSNGSCSDLPANADFPQVAPQVNTRGIGTRVSQISGSANWGYIAATFDNVKKNSSSYDNFDSSNMIDVGNWWGTLELVRMVDNCELVSELTQRGVNGTNNMSFVNSQAILGFKADLKVLEFQNNGARPLGRLYASLYNDGTGNSTPGDLTGDVIASIGILEQSSDPVPPALPAPRAFYAVSRCLAPDCNLPGEYQFLTSGDLGPVNLNETHHFSVSWDGSQLTFGFDGSPLSYIPPVPVSGPPKGRKGIGTRVTEINDPDAVSKWAYVAASFDNVAVLSTGYPLTVTKSGTGTGTVTSSPSGINCGSDCGEGYPSGTPVTLNAWPDAGSTFAGWSGACTGTGSCMPIMNSPQIVKATFTLVPGVEANVSVSPASYDFGSTYVGTSSLPNHFTVSNTGTANLTIGSVAIVGDSDFVKGGDGCSGQTVVPASSCDVSVHFTPIMAGSRSANLSIPSNDPDTPIFNVLLTGVGCAYSISPTSGTHSPSGGTGSFDVSTPGTCLWTVVSNYSWITITAPSAGWGIGPGSVTYSVAANSGSTRSGTITAADQTFTVNQYGGPFAPPVLVSPTNGELNVPVDPTLTWNASTGAGYYGLQVATDLGFSSIVVNQVGIIGTSYPVPTGKLLNGTTYYWRVYAADIDLGASDWSDTWHFATEAAPAGPPAPPTLVSPANGQTQVPTNPTLTWNASSGATSYQLQVSTDPSFTAGTTVFYPPGTSYPISGLSNNTTYYWRVEDNSIQNNWSAIWSFITQSSSGNAFLGAGGVLDPDQEPDGIDDDFEQNVIKTDRTRKTLFIRPKLEITAPAPGVEGTYVYWADFKNYFTISSDGHVDIPPFTHANVEVVIIGPTCSTPPCHQYAPFDDFNYAPATDPNFTASPANGCDILEIVLKNSGAYCLSANGNYGHTFFDSSKPTWTWDTKGYTPSGGPYGYGTPEIYPFAHENYFKEGAYSSIAVNQVPTTISNPPPNTCKSGQCYDFTKESPMNWSGAVPPGGMPDATVEFDTISFDKTSKAVTSVGAKGREYLREAVYKRTIVHELGHALGMAHCNNPACPMYGNSKDWDLNDFGSGGNCTHNPNALIHNGPATPRAPFLRSPLNNAQVTRTAVTLTWSPSKGMTNYQLQVSTGNQGNFSATLVNVTLPPNQTTYTVTNIPATSQLTNYYWRVRGGNLINGVLTWGPWQSGTPQFFKTQ